jgi:WD repeat-containing protein 23
MDSGTFGSNEYYLERSKRRKSKLASRLMRRELGLEPDARRKRFNMLMAQVIFLC